jgi:hypothetical protein
VEALIPSATESGAGFGTAPRRQIESDQVCNLIRTISGFSAGRGKCGPRAIGSIALYLASDDSS